MKRQAPPVTTPDSSRVAHLFGEQSTDVAFGNLDHEERREEPEPTRPQLEQPSDESLYIEKVPQSPSSANDSAAGGNLATEEPPTEVKPKSRRSYDLLLSDRIPLTAEEIRHLSDRGEEGIQLIRKCRDIAGDFCTRYYAHELDDVILDQIGDVSIICAARYSYLPEHQLEKLVLKCTYNSIRRALGHRANRHGALPINDVLQDRDGSLLDESDRIRRQEESRDCVSSALGHLIGSYKFAVYLREIVGMDYPEIALRMNKTVENVRQLVSRGMKKLKKLRQNAAKSQT